MSGAIEVPKAADLNPHPFWKTLIAGLATLIIGAAMLWGTLSVKLETYRLLVFLLGLWWLIAGLLDIAHIFTDRTAWGWKLFMGIVSILAGGVILTYPMGSAIALPRIFVLLLGFWSLIYGIILLVSGFRGEGWGAGILGALALVFGGILVGSYSVPGIGLSLLWAASIGAVIGGIGLILQAFWKRKA